MSTTWIVLLIFSVGSLFLIKFRKFDLYVKVCIAVFVVSYGGALPMLSEHRAVTVPQLSSPIQLPKGLV